MKALRGSCRGPAGAAALLAVLALAPELRAAEIVTLKNGFELNCDHQEAAGARVRLFTGPGAQNFIEVDRGEILSVEPAPEAPAHRAAAPPEQAKLTDSDMRQILARAGAEHNLDVDLLASVIRAESNGDSHAVSRAGARGLMQLMPATASEMGVEDSFRPAQNVGGGAAYLDALLLRYRENVALALAAYNAGPAAVDRYHGVPPYAETRAYVARVIREFNRRKLAEEAALQAQRRRASR